MGQISSTCISNFHSLFYSSRTILAVKGMGENFNDILNQCTTIINFICVRAVNFCIFSLMREEFGSAYNNIIITFSYNEIEVFLREKNSQLSDY